MNPRRSSNPLALLCGAISLALAVQVWAADSGPADRPQPGPPPAPASQPTVDLSGTVDGFNLGPRSEPESLMLKTSSDTVQLNFPPHLAQSISQTVQIGDSVKATAIKDRAAEDSDHPVYRLLKLTGASGQTVAEDDLAPPKDVHVEAAVKRLNYGRRGEVNGVQLDNGDFVHMPPEDAEDLKLKVGDKVSVDGRARPLSGGHNAIAASNINGTEIQPPQRGPGPDGPGGPGGPDQRDGGPRGPGGQDGPGNSPPPDAPPPDRPPPGQ